LEFFGREKTFKYRGTREEFCPALGSGFKGENEAEAWLGTKA